MKFLIWALMLFWMSPLWATEQLLHCPPETRCSCPENLVQLPTQYALDKDDMPGTVWRCLKMTPALQNALLTSPSCLGANPSACNPCVDTSNPGAEFYAKINKSFPKGCGYAWKKFNTPGFKETLAAFLKDGTIKCSKRHQSMCTSATFLAFLLKAKELVTERKLTREQVEAWADLHGPAWAYLNDQARPDLLLKNLNLGEGRVLRKNEIPTKNWPAQGDLVQVWRSNRSGHSVVFSNFLKSPEGKNIGICYWSSNQSTDGYGERCEPIEKVDHLVAARFK